MNIKPLILFCIPTIATTLYASHYDGHIFTLSLSLPDSSDTNNTNNSLTLTNTLQACGSMPSWLTLDTDENVLYCIDESGTKSSGNGSVSAFAVSADGSLTASADTETVAGGVSSVIYQASDKKFLAVAHYSGAAVSTFQLPLSSNSDAYQVFTYTLSEPGTDPARQDAPHVHQVILDPTGQFVLAFDLGADLIRIFAIDAADGKLRECEPFKVTGGNGPRHGAFYVPSSSDETRLYVTNELANTVSVYAVDYPSNEITTQTSSTTTTSTSSSNGCLSLSSLGDTTPYPSSTPLPSNAYVAEIHIPNDGTHDAYVSIRTDQGFAPDDSMATLEIVDGTTTNGDNTDTKASKALSFKKLTSAYGTVPRTFALSPDGSMVAIGDQASSNVAVVARDVDTGELGQLLGSVQVGTQGQPGQSNGLSSVIWGE